MIVKIEVKNPSELEAIQFIGTGTSFEECDDFTDGYLFCNDSNNLITFSTDEGALDVEVGYWFIRNYYGAWMVTDEEFQKNYKIINE